MFRRRERANIHKGEGIVESKLRQQLGSNRDGTDSSNENPSLSVNRVATSLWEADVATLERIGALFDSDIPQHWRFINHTTGETMALREYSADVENKVLFLQELTKSCMMRIDEKYLAISTDPDEKWDMTTSGLRVRWGANIWEGSFNDDRTVWSSTPGFVRQVDGYIWEEVIACKKKFTFIEVKREGYDHVHLMDLSRSLHVRLKSSCMEFHTKEGDDTWQVVKRGHWTENGENALTQQRLGEICVAAWTVDDVCDFFTSLKLSTCVSKVRELGIDGTTLIHVDDCDLRNELRIESSILRKKILAHISQAKHVSSPARLVNDSKSNQQVEESFSHSVRIAGHLSGSVATSDDAACKADKVDGNKGQTSAMPTVFLSYTWKYQHVVNAVRDSLEKHGFSTWMDVQKLSGGDNLLAQIDEGIRSSDLVVSFVSSEYAASEYCRKEVLLAENLKKTILCVLVESAPRIPWPPTGPSS